MSGWRHMQEQNESKSLLRFFGFDVRVPNIQRLAKSFVNLAKQDPGRAGQNS